MSKDNGGPAFGELQQVGDVAMRDGGLSIRDYFAAKAVTGLLMCNLQVQSGADMYARDAYTIADAMLMERSK